MKEYSPWNVRERLGGDRSIHLSYVPESVFLDSKPARSKPAHDRSRSLHRAPIDQRPHPSIARPNPAIAENDPAACPYPTPTDSARNPKTSTTDPRALVCVARPSIPARAAARTPHGSAAESARCYPKTASGKYPAALARHCNRRPESPALQPPADWPRAPSTVRTKPA